MDNIKIVETKDKIEVSLKKAYGREARPLFKLNTKDLTPNEFDELSKYFKGKRGY